MTWTKDQDQRLLNMMETGASDDAMAQAFGVRRRAIRDRRRILTKGGKIANAWSLEERQRALALIQQGLTSRQVSIALDRTYEATRRICLEIRKGYVTQRPERKHIAKPKAASVQLTSGDERYLAAVVAEGGFPAFSERIASNGQPIACFPLVQWRDAA